MTNNTNRKPSAAAIAEDKAALRIIQREYRHTINRLNARFVTAKERAQLEADKADYGRQIHQLIQNNPWIIRAADYTVTK